jgi:starch phosphorylase
VHSNNAPFTEPDHGLPERLQALARNLWWTWHPEVISIFRELDPVRWRQLDHNPIAFLAEFSLERLQERVKELVLQCRIDNAYRRLQEYLQSDLTWGAVHAGVLRVPPVAYFSAEFGLHESLPIYSGGLGVLAGDHLKSASDLGVPLVAVGLFYAQGYFLQRLNPDGWQNEESPSVRVGELPQELPTGPDGSPISVSIETRSGAIRARVWKMAVGAQFFAVARLGRRWQSHGRSAADRPPVSGRQAHPHAPGIVARSRRPASADRPGDSAGRTSSQRGA